MRRPSLAHTLVELTAYILGAAVVTGALFVVGGVCVSLIALNARSPS